MTRTRRGRAWGVVSAGAVAFLLWPALAGAKGDGTRPASPGEDHPKAESTDAPGPTFGADTRTVRVPVSVLDKAGQPLLGLETRDFRVSDDGRRQAVTLFSAERRPLRIALALDVSRSMDNRMAQVEEALTHFVDLLEPADEILVMTFNDRVKVVQDFTSDRQQLGHALDALEPSGGTALYDAAFAAIQRVAARPADAKAVVLVTDGVDTASAVSFKDLRESARRAEVPVFSIGLDAGPRHDVTRAGGPGHGGSHGGWPGGGGRGGGFGGGGRGGFGGGRSSAKRPASFDARPLTDLADETGAAAEIVKGLGHYAPGSDEPPGSERLKAAVETIAMILRHRYLLGYEPPAPGRREWRTIQIEVDRPDTVARARKGYYGGN